MKDPICCPPRVDTFLAVTKVKPVEPEKTRKTVQYKRKKVQELVECLGNELPEDFWP